MPKGKGYKSGGRRRKTTGRQRAAAETGMTGTGLGRVRAPGTGKTRGMRKGSRRRR